MLHVAFRPTGRGHKIKIMNKHICKYCGIETVENDLYCYKNNEISMEDYKVNMIALEHYPKDIVETSKGCWDDLNEQDRNNFIKGYKQAIDDLLSCQKAIPNEAKEYSKQFKTQVSFEGMENIETDFINGSKKLIELFINRVVSVENGL
jgi:hypothetical protein